MPLQPFLHDLLPAVSAPTQAWVGPDGQVRRGGAQGVYHADTRVLDSLVLTVDGTEPEVLRSGPRGPGAVETLYAARSVDGPGADPTTWVRRLTRVGAGVVTTELTVETVAPAGARGHVELTAMADLASLEAVKQGIDVPTVEPTLDGACARWASGATQAVLSAPGAGLSTTADGAVRVTWPVDVPARQAQTLVCRVEVTDPGAVMTAPPSPVAEWTTPAVRADDPRLARLVTRSLGDLSTLRMSWSRTPDDVFLAAGAPWFFTLFGRDSLWAARLLLPLGTDLARGTLRTLAAGQGDRTDAATAQQPGKILHEVRGEDLRLGDGTVLPPLYYGTVDSTPLWVCLLHDAWRWGLPDADVEALLPHLEAALGWMAEHGDGDGDGFLDYVDVTGTGLSNQGWKDSGDSIQWRDGTIAEGPIALSEVQAYAYEAAVGAADLLDTFGRPGGAAWRGWAAALRDRFRDRFWTSDATGPYVGIALDRHGRLVDSVASNMGHLLGTGLLDAAEERVVADRLAGPEMSSGYGLRTLSSAMGGFWPLSYHGGAVWSHDTAITVAGMARAGLHAQASVLVRGLLAAAEELDFQLPELFGGSDAGSTPGVVPYPASCHPQAWSAAGSVAVLQAVLGLQPSPDGIELHPSSASPVGAVEVTGIRAHGRTWTAEVRTDGSTSVTS